MEYRQLGRSGLRVSTFTLGTMGYGGTGWAAMVGQIGVEGVRDQLAVARDYGINLVDTADVYSAGMSEELLGEALGTSRDDFLLATKCRMPMGEGPNDAGLSRHHVLRSAEASLRRLRTDHIDLYQVHEWDGQTPLEETLSALDDLVRSGKVRYIGVSNYAAWQLMKALGVSDARGYERFVSQQIHYSMHSRHVEDELVPVSIDQGLGILVWSPLAGGLLSGKYRRGVEPPAGSRHLTAWDEPPVPDEDRLYDIIETAVAIGADHGVSAAQVVARVDARAARGDVPDRRRAHGRAAARTAWARRTWCSATTSSPGSTRSAASRCATRSGTRPRPRPTGSARPTWCSGAAEPRAPPPTTSRPGPAAGLGAWPSRAGALGRDRRAAGQRIGPSPAPVALRAAAISARSASVSSSEAAGSQPSTCSGDRAPTIAPDTPGTVRVQAAATGPTPTPCRSAIGRSASTRARLRASPSPEKSGLRERQSSGAQGGGALRGERPGEQAGGHRRVDDHAGPVRRGPRDDVAGGVAVQQVERRLEGADVRDLLGRVELGDGVVGQADRAHLALVDQGLEHRPVVLDAAVVRRPVHLVEVDALDAEQPQRLLDLAAQARRVAHPAGARGPGRRPPGAGRPW